MNFAEKEQQILKFWKENKIFEKSLEIRKRGPKFTFYDGPPFANGLPHYGHILAMAIKDLVARYKTMRGYYVPRKNGWDCHGLPVEYEAEKELGISGKKEIEKYGIERFNQYCRQSIFRYTKEWEEIMERMARWIDFKNSYATLDNNYIESVWWIFKQLWNKGLIYRDLRSVSYCPRCATPLSNFEVNLGYKDNVEDPSIFVKFPILDSKNTYLLVWTTTPWTLSGNAALAIGEKIDYVKITLDNSESLILAESNLSVIAEKYKITKKITGKDLVGMKYQPLYYSDLEIQDSNLYKIVSADFVSLEEGTGVVHIAPAYGEEDFNLGKEKNIPPIIAIDENGKFNVDPFFRRDKKSGREDKLNIKGKFIKEADKDIIENLKERNLLYKVETIRHTYPFCWRCEAPVYDFLWPSWFVKVAKIKNELIENNKKIYWIPHHLKEGRFGKWLEGVRDWNVSRNRFWGAPIPVWICKKCGQTECLGSISEMKDQNKEKRITKIILLRHGESLKNTQDIFDSSIKDSPFDLSEKGLRQVEKLAKKLKREIKVPVSIYSSPVPRAKQTAEITAQAFNLKYKEDCGLRECNNGSWEGKHPQDEKIKESRRKYKSLSMEEQYVTKRGEFGESWKDIEERVYKSFKKILQKEKNKTIILITHQASIIYLLKTLKKLDLAQTVALFDKDIFQAFAQPIETYIDHTTLTEIDLHKEVVDKIVLVCPKCKGEMTRTPEILDCWFESGAMPYAQLHYPFENKKGFKENFPADFIAEGLDQTRGWFYTLNVLSTALFNQPAFKNVIVNGIVLTGDGKKLSKRLKNYLEPAKIFDTLGVDALRYFLYSSAPIGEDYRFSEQRVKEKFRNVILTLWNVLGFWKLYSQPIDWQAFEKKASYQLHILDKWILARLNQLIKEMTKYLEKYDLTKASRPIENFIQDLSTWHIRRSRERLKKAQESFANKAQIPTQAKTRMIAPQEVLGEVLLNLSKVMAPFTPFIAEEIYQQTTINKQQSTNNGHKLSVHLCDWPKVDQKMIDENLLAEMQKIRQICELGHKARAEAGIKVRQPLEKLRIETKDVILKSLTDAQDRLRNKTSSWSETRDLSELKDLIKDELNVKKIEMADELSKAEINDDWKIAEDPKFRIALNIKITPALKREGIAREFIRQINTLRKEAGLTIKDNVTLSWQTDSRELKEVFKKFEEQIKQETLSQISSLKRQIPTKNFKKKLLIEEEEISINLSW